jgi:hypothetical protein
MIHLKKVKTTVPIFDFTYFVQEILNNPRKYLNMNIFIEFFKKVCIS